jgi:uncharacterized OB-fold protein
VEQFGIPIGEPHIVKDDTGSIKLACGCCGACGALSFPHAQVCIECLSENIKIEEMPDYGTLYSYSIVRVGQPKDKVPYAVGYIDLENGLRLFSHISDIIALKINLPVSIRVTSAGEAEDSAPLYQFWAVPRKNADA